MRRSFAVRRLRWAPLVGASAAVVRRTISVCGAALQTSSQTYATNLASSLASSLCAPVSRPYPEMQPHLYRIRLSLLAPNVAYLAHLRYLAVENEGSCQKSGGFHQAGEEVVSLNSGWLCLRFSDLAICSGGIETGSINRFHGFWIRVGFDGKTTRFDEECRFSGSYPLLQVNCNHALFETGRNRSFLFVKMDERKAVGWICGKTTGWRRRWKNRNRLMRGSRSFPSRRR